VSCNAAASHGGIDHHVLDMSSKARWQRKGDESRHADDSAASPRNDQLGGIMIEHRANPEDVERCGFRELRQKTRELASILV
jgi:hypothetical protein